MINAEVQLESNNWNKIIKNPNKLILETIKKFPKDYKFLNKRIYITVLLTNNKKIQLLNKNFRKKNKPTDILSFPFFDKQDLKKNLKNKKIYLGDIAISYEEFLKKNRDDYKNGFIKIFIHGFLHLLNFDHKSNKEFKKMSLIENKLFQKVKG
tara:strand:+ start:2348 stop:2806 length:459 start_codon:yes stop_codon:yes gene_type:complete